jgi:hypothetical protein
VAGIGKWTKLEGEDESLVKMGASNLLELSSVVALAGQELGLQDAVRRRFDVDVVGEWIDIKHDVGSGRKRYREREDESLVKMGASNLLELSSVVALAGQERGRLTIHALFLDQLELNLGLQDAVRRRFDVDVVGEWIDIKHDVGSGS